MEVVLTILYDDPGGLSRHGNFGRGRERAYTGGISGFCLSVRFSLVALPLFLYLRRGNGRHVIPRLAAFLENGGDLSVCPAIVLVEVTLRRGDREGPYYH